MGVSLSALCALVSASQVVAPPAPAAENDTGRFQGRWVVTSLKHADFELKGTASSPLRVKFDGNRMISHPSVSITDTLSMQLHLGPVLQVDKSSTIVLSKKPMVATFELGPEPGHITVVEPDGDKTRTKKGIYRFTDSGIEICMGRSSRKPPDEFKATRHALLFKLEKQEKLADAASDSLQSSITTR